VFARGDWKRRQLIEPRDSREADEREVADQVIV